MKEVFYCAIRIIGSPFVVLTEEEAKNWVSENPEMNYYNTLSVRDIPPKIQEQEGNK